MAHTKQNEILMELESAKTKVDTLMEENHNLVRTVDELRSETQESLIQIFEKVDPKRAINAIG